MPLNRESATKYRQAAECLQRASAIAFAGYSSYTRICEHHVKVAEAEANAALALIKEAGE